MRRPGVVGFSHLGWHRSPSVEWPLMWPGVAETRQETRGHSVNIQLEVKSMLSHWHTVSRERNGLEQYSRDGL